MRQPRATVTRSVKEHDGESGDPPCAARTALRAEARSDAPLGLAEARPALPEHGSEALPRRWYGVLAERALAYCRLTVGE